MTYRLDILFANVVIDPARLVGDLTRRLPRRGMMAALTGGTRLGAAVLGAREDATLLALDWSGACEDLRPGDELVLGDQFLRID